MVPLFKNELFTFVNKLTLSCYQACLNKLLISFVYFTDSGRRNAAVVCYA